MSAAPRITIKNYEGFTLLELLLTVVIISVLAVAAIPSGAPLQQLSLDTGVQQTLQALQFARQEALRTDSNATVSIDPITGTLRVYQLDFSSGQPVEKVLAHPMTKREYHVTLTSLNMSGSRIGIEALFKFSDGTSASAIGFDKTGAPGKVIGKSTVTPLQITGSWRGLWQPGVSYRLGDWVVWNNQNWDSLTNHNSSSDFALDVSRWQRRTASPHITVSTNAHREVLNVAPTTGFARVGAW